MASAHTLKWPPNLAWRTGKHQSEPSQLQFKPTPMESMEYLMPPTMRSRSCELLRIIWGKFRKRRHATRCTPHATRRMLHVLHKPQAAWISRSIRKEPLNHDWTDVRFVVEIAGNFGAQKKTTIKLRRKERDYEGFTHGYKLHSAKGHATIATAAANCNSNMHKANAALFFYLIARFYLCVCPSVCRIALLSALQNRGL